MAIGTPHLTRHLDLESAFNVRDLGGYQGRAGQTLRWRRVLRADDLSRATPADRDHLASLGIATVVDLRTDRECRASRVPVLRGSPVEIHHLPMVREGWADPLDGADDEDVEELLARRTLELLVEGAPAIADALRILAQPAAQPAVLLSTMGKDRAGLAAAVILALLGVPTRVIAEDYALSSLALAAEEQWLRTHDPATHAARWTEPSALLAAPPRAMVKVLDQVNAQCGSMVGFARGIGVEFEVIEALHRQLLV